jgi:hypothetical protein
MNREQIVGVLNAMHRAWNSRDAVALASAHTDDGVVYSPIFGEVHGRAAIEKTYRDLFLGFADWTFEPVELVVDGLRAAQLFNVTAARSECSACRLRTGASDSGCAGVRIQKEGKIAVGSASTTSPGC